MAAIGYAEAGVNREAAEKVVERIAVLSQSTQSPKVRAAIGGYASLFALDKERWIAASTDGVGTKLKLAFRLQDHSTIGIDLVAMSVNDLLCVGALPLFFLDYFATGKLDPSVTESVLKGIVEGCRQARCALVGGETAEMPGFYLPGEYDLAGFAVGVVHPKSVLPRKDIRPGDILIGFASSGFHSNGYSLLRKLVPTAKKGDSLARELLTPTRIYVSSVQPLLKDRLVKGLAHITGSGFLNVPRMSDQVSYEIHLPPLEERPPIFSWVQDQARLSLVEFAQTFNMGIGMVAVVSKKNIDLVMKKLKRAGEKAWILGEVVKTRPRRGSEIFLQDGTDFVSLSYD